MTTTQSIKQFLQDLPRSEKTKRTYAQGLKLFAKVVGEHATLDAESYKRFLIETKDLHPGTQITYRAAVRAMLLRLDVSPSLLKRYTSDYGLIPSKSVPEYDAESLDKLINYAETLTATILDLRDRAFILTLVGTGLRISEACSLTRAQVDMVKKQTIIVGKGRKKALVRFSDHSIEAIQDYLQARAGADGASGRPLATLPVFARHDKGGGKKIKPLGAGGAWVAFKGRLVEAGAERLAVRVHDTRHFFVTNALKRNGGNLRVAQELARHESPTTTARYAHLTNPELDNAFDRAVNQ